MKSQDSKTSNLDIKVDKKISNIVDEYNFLEEKKLDKLLQISIIKYNRAAEKVKIQKHMDEKRKNEFENKLNQILVNKRKSFTTKKIPKATITNKNSLNATAPQLSSYQSKPERPTSSRPSNKTFTGRSRKLLDSSMKMIGLSTSSSPNSSTKCCHSSITYDDVSTITMPQSLNYQQTTDVTMNKSSQIPITNDSPLIPTCTVEKSDDFRNVETTEQTTEQSKPGFYKT